MKETINAGTGEVKAGQGIILKSSAIGSCVVIAAYDSEKKVGALAHVMLPGASPKGKTFQKTRYAADAVDEIMNRMAHLGASKDSIEVCLVGGGNVLKRKDDAICQENIASVAKLLNEKRIKIKATAVGGTKRRSISFDVKRGAVYYTEGDAKEKLLWKATDNEKQKTRNEGRNRPAYFNRGG